MDQTSQTEKVYQKAKYDEIIEILLSAGYFRARINTLSEFDKVVGGLCWCLTSTGEDVDVDILFQENSTIGQRIVLSEAIVKALRKMNCPAQIQPHQIQGGVGGSDFPALHPVIVWLVKKFFERREEREAQLRSFAVLQFSKNYELPTEIKASGLSNEISAILSKTKAIRTFRRRELKGESEETRVRSCLLEYGESFATAQDGAPEQGSAGAGGATGGSKSSSSGASGGRGAADLTPTALRIPVELGGEVSLQGLSKLKSSDLSGFEKKLAQAARDAAREEQLFAEHASKEEAELMQQMHEVSEDGGAVSGANVGAIVGLGSSEIGVAAAAYQEQLEQSRRLIDQNLAGGKLGLIAQHKRQRLNLITQRDEVEARSLELRTNADAMLERLHIIEDERNNALEYNGQLRAQIVKLGDLEANSSQQSELAMLKHLVGLNESMRAQELAFKASCKAQMQDYNARIQALEDAQEDNNAENQQLLDIEDMHSKVLAKYNRLRQMLADTNLEVASTARVIDDIPTRTELIQYERRFVELYSQVAWKLDETRKYFDMYNTLDTTLSFLQKEIKLLNSISENFTEAMKSASSKQEYLKQLEQIVKGVEDSLHRQEGVLTQRSQKVEELKVQHQNLVDEQRKYFKAVKDFQDECNKNEFLTTKLEQLTAH